ncbi:hypothetical protein [Alicyclobacillus sp. ALC3]|uniref:hypothetical protein n=1 Tax=Alicyclobacillus sp. ALC3 TaxID=2796143 RepID=UPI0023785494|nr:hypothetical protein [Alicyclobacillus sp. ALC3]
MKELDVVGFDFANDTVYLCEVTTHPQGALYGNSADETTNRIIKKHKWQRQYAKQYLNTFSTLRFQFWSPYVPLGRTTRALSEMQILEMIINEDYTSRVNELRDLARATRRDTGNPVFRTLQILEHLR